MEQGYGTSPTQAVMLQASFKPKTPQQFSLHSGSGGGGGDRSKVQLSLHFAGEKGVSLYELSLKQPPAPKPQQEGGSWLEWFPKVGVFGIAMIGVVIWNVRKMSGGGGGGDGLDFDEDLFKDRLRKGKKDAGLG